MIQLLQIDREHRSFAFLWKVVLRLLIIFFVEVERQYVEYGLHVDFLKSPVNGRLFGLFTWTSLMGMLEAADFNIVDMVSPFLGAIIEDCCGLVRVASIFDDFSRHVLLFNKILSTREQNWMVLL